jgi:glycosidase
VARDASLHLPASDSTAASRLTTPPRSPSIWPNSGSAIQYCSPSLQAAEGSTHGDDVVDRSRINDELGGAAGHARLVDAVAAERLGEILDVVPNHMARGGPANR